MELANRMICGYCAKEQVSYGLNMTFQPRRSDKILILSSLKRISLVSLRLTLVKSIKVSVWKHECIRLMLDFAFEWKHFFYIFVIAAVRQWKAMHQLWKHDDERYTHQPLGGRTGMQKQSQNEQVHLSNNTPGHICLRLFSSFIR